MNKININIPFEIKNLIQKFDIDASTREDIIKYILSNNISIPKEQLNFYQQEYNKYLYEFNIAKQELEKQYVLPVIKKTDKYTWRLNYTTSILTIEVQNDNIC